MRCVKCQAEIPDDSTFCGKCGAAQGETGAPDAPGLADNKQTQPLGPEEDVWQDRPSGWGMIGRMSIVAIVTIACIVIAILAKGKWIWVLPAATLAAGLLWLLVGLIKLKYGHKYRVSTQRLFIEIGIFSKKFDEVELIRVDDVVVEQGLVQRMFHIGNVRVLSGDPTDPVLVIKGVPNPQEVKEAIREHARQMRRRTLFMETT